MFEDEKEFEARSKHSYKKCRTGEKIPLTNGRELVIQLRHKNMGSLIKILRENVGMTIEELIKQCQIPKTAYQRLEAGLMDIKYVYIERVLGYFGYSLMPFFDINNKDMIINLSNSLKKTDFLIAAKMAKMAETMPIFKKFNKQGRDLDKFFERAKRYQEIRLAKNNDEKKEIRKKYAKIIRGIDAGAYNLLDYKPKAESQRQANVIIKKYNQKRLEKMKAVRKRNIMGKKFFKQLYDTQSGE